jgi:hypothetical protein
MSDSKPDRTGQLVTGLAPEARNTSQVDRPAQAQTLATQAENITQEVRSPTESQRPGVAINLFGDSTQDTIDHMRDMESSGRIDMDAFAGEPDHDDRARPVGRDRQPQTVAFRRD